RAVVAAHVVDDGFVEAVAADAHGVGEHDAVQRNHSDLGGAAADVEHHGAARVGHRHAGADGRRHGLLYEMHLARAGAERGFLDGAPFHLRRTAGHAHEHARARLEQHSAVRRVDEILKHLLRDGEVRDDAVLERTDRGDMPGRAPEHALCFRTDGDDRFRIDRVAVLAYRYDGWLVENDPLAAHVDERVRGAEIDGGIIGEESPDTFQHRIRRPPACRTKSSGSACRSWEYATICTNPARQPAPVDPPRIPAANPQTPAGSAS